MNSELTRILRSAATAAQAILGESFTLGGTTYKGVVRGDVTMQPGRNGLERVEELHIVATKAQFATEPTAAPRTAVTYGGRSYWLTAVNDDELNYFFTLVPQ